MEIIDWIAILGALAWLPHLIKLIKSYLTKPEVRIITHDKAEIGLTTLGPIFNMHLAFVVSNHSVVITNFKIRVTHESGEEKHYQWQVVKEQVLKMHTSEGTVPYEKEKTVLALKLNQNEVEERFIQCQESSFISGKRDMEDKALKRLSYEKEQEDYEPLKFLKCQECTDVYNYIRHEFSWKSGKYKILFELQSPEVFRLVDNEYEFNLKPLDIEALQENKSLVEQDYINSFVGEENSAYKPVSWNWRNPSIYKRNS